MSVDNIAVLFALALVRLLNVGEVRVERPRNIGVDTLRRVIADRD